MLGYSLSLNILLISLIGAEKYGNCLLTYYPTSILNFFEMMPEKYYYCWSVKGDDKLFLVFWKKKVFEQTVYIYKGTQIYCISLYYKYLVHPGKIYNDFRMPYRHWQVILVYWNNLLCNAA